MIRRPGWTLTKLAAFGVAVAALSAGLAWATIPGSGGTINACYAKTNGRLRVIDADQAGTCKSSEIALTWNQTGPPGTPPPPLGSVDIDYAQKATDVLVNGGNIGTADTVIKSNTTTYDGSKVYIDFFAASTTASDSHHFFVLVYRDTTLIGEVAYYLSPPFTEQSVSFQVADIPSTGSHSYTVKAYGGGPVTVRGAPDTAEGHQYFPMHLRITRV